MKIYWVWLINQQLLQAGLRHRFAHLGPQDNYPAPTSLSYHNTNKCQEQARKAVIYSHSSSAWKCCHICSSLQNPLTFQAKLLTHFRFLQCLDKTQKLHEATLDSPEPTGQSLVFSSMSCSSQSTQCDIYFFQFLVSLVILLISELEKERRREWIGPKILHPLIYSLITYSTHILLCSYYELGTILGPGHTAGNKTEKAPVPMELPLQWRQILIQLLLLMCDGKEIGLN